jgi:predicted Zn-dependent peptidase
VKRSQLPNGVGVTVVTRAQSDSTSVYLRVPSASDTSTGDVAVMAEALRAGTLHGSKGELYVNPRLGQMPIRIATDATGTTFSWSVLPKGTPKALELLGEFVLKPAFDKEEVRIRLQQELADIQGESVALWLHTRRLARGAIPTLKAPTQEEDARGLFQLEPARLKQIHACTIHPTGAELVVVGPVEAGKALAWASAAFGGWAAQAAGSECAKWRAPVLTADPARTRLERAEVQLISGTVGDPVVVIDVPGPAIDSPDYVPFMLLTYVLESRRSGAAKELRHAGGTYGIHSNLIDSYPHLTLLELQGQVEPESLEPALRGLIADLRGLATSLQESELAAVKRSTRNGLINWLTANDAVAWLVLNHARRGLGVDHLLDSPNELLQLDLARCREVAQRWLSNAEPSIVVTGPVERDLGIHVNSRRLAWTRRPQAYKKP